MDRAYKKISNNSKKSFFDFRMEIIEEIFKNQNVQDPSEQNQEEMSVTRLVDCHFISYNSSNLIKKEPSYMLRKNGCK